MEITHTPRLKEERITSSPTPPPLVGEPPLHLRSRATTWEEAEEARVSRDQVDQVRDKVEVRVEDKEEGLGQDLGQELKQRP